MSRKIEEVKNKIEEYMIEINKYSSEIISKYTDTLDSIMRDIKNDVIDSDNVDDALLQHYFLSLTNALYFIGSSVESVGFYDDISELNYKLAYNEAFIENKAKSVGNAVKQTNADNHYENSPDFSSGGINVGHIASGYFSVYFTTNEKMTLNALLKIAHPSGNKLGEKVTSITIDGTEVTYDKEIILDSAPGNQYWNYKDVALPCGELEAGLHELRFNFNGGAGNIDCIDLTFTK